MSAYLKANVDIKDSGTFSGGKSSWKIFILYPLDQRKSARYFL